jgi:hypothetical protein
VVRRRGGRPRAHRSARRAAPRPRPGARPGARLRAGAARRRRPAPAPLLAGADDPEPAPGHRREGHRGRAHLLRAARRLRPRGQPRARARRGGAVGGQRRRGAGRHLDHLAAQEGRGVARRPAVHCRRRGVQVGVRGGSSDRGDQPRSLSRSGARREARGPRGAGRVQAADAVLGRGVLRLHGDPAPRVRRAPRRPLPRRGGQPPPGRHRAVPLSTSSRATPCAPSSIRAITSPAGRRSITWR